MLKGWQFNILFFVGVGGVLLLLIGPELGLDVTSNPTALAALGSILAYILTQKNSLTKNKKKQDEEEKIPLNQEGADAASGNETDNTERTPDDEH